MSRAERRVLVDRTDWALPVSQQCRLLAVSRSSVYRRPAEVGDEDRTIMALIDRQYLARPYYGSRRMAAWLATQGHVVNRKQVRAADAANGSGGDLPAPEHQQGSRGAQDLPVPARWDRDRAGQSGVVLGRYLYPDGQGLSLSGGRHGLGQPRGAGVAAVEYAGRRFLCRGARGGALPLPPARDLQYRPEPALAKAGGSQFTSDDFTGTLKDHGITISMDGKGRCMDNIFVERLWRSLKYEEVYLHAYATVAEAKAGIGAWLEFLQ